MLKNGHIASREVKPKKRVVRYRTIKEKVVFSDVSLGEFEVVVARTAIHGKLV